MARGRGSGKKSGPKPTSKPRTRKQTTKDRYAHAREDAQLEGLIPTTPEEALKPEQVNPVLQGDGAQSLLPALITQAIRNGWATPDDRKPVLVDELLQIISNPEMPAKVKVAAFNALRMADQAQYERDHPEEAAKSKTGGTTIYGNVTQNNVQVAATTIREMIERGELGLLEEIPISDQPSTSGG